MTSLFTFVTALLNNSESTTVDRLAASVSDVSKVYGWRFWGDSLREPDDCHTSVSRW